MENVDLALWYVTSIYKNGAFIKVVESDDDTEIATLIISNIIDGEEADVDLIPVSKFFSPIGKDGNKNTDPFMDWIKDAIGDIFVKLIEGRELRRLTAMIPSSRSRTAKILRECGFRKEGVKRDAVKFTGNEPEDVVIMGMLPTKE